MKPPARAALAVLGAEALPRRRRPVRVTRKDPRPMPLPEHLETIDRAALLILMSKGGEATTAELVDALGEPLPDLAPLRAARLIGTEDGDALELLDAGWLWCSRELTAGPPPDVDLKKDPLIGALYAVMDLIGRYLEAADLSLGEFVMIARGEMEPPARLHRLHGRDLHPRP